MSETSSASPNQFLNNFSELSLDARSLFAAIERAKQSESWQHVDAIFPGFAIEAISPSSFRVSWNLGRVEVNVDDGQRIDLHPTLMSSSDPWLREFKLYSPKDLHKPRYGVSLYPEYRNSPSTLFHLALLCGCLLFGTVVVSYRRFKFIYNMFQNGPFDDSLVQLSDDLRAKYEGHVLSKFDDYWIENRVKDEIKGAFDLDSTDAVDDIKMNLSVQTVEWALRSPLADSTLIQVVRSNEWEGKRGVFNEEQAFYAIFSGLFEFSDFIAKVSHFMAQPLQDETVPEFLTFPVDNMTCQVCRKEYKRQDYFLRHLVEKHHLKIENGSYRLRNPKYDE